MGKGRRWSVAAVMLLATTTAGALAAPVDRIAPDSPGCILRATPPKVGIKELSRTASGRLLTLELQSDAMQNTQHVNVLVPEGYDPSGATRYPVLYLLHGALGSYVDWAANGAQAALGDFPAIVVMPDDGVDGSYSDWYGLPPQETGPVPAWETYHLSELVPFVDATFPTIPDRSHRFIAGLSSGGGGSTKYAAARPGMFGAVGAFSGAVDTDLDYPQYPAISEALWGTTAIPTQGPEGHCTWGDFATQRVIWRDNTATPMAENLEGTPLFLASGTGDPGPYDASAPYTDPTEYEVWHMNLELVKALDAAGIPHTDDFYGPGHHSWPYWIDDLKLFLAWLRPKVGAPVPAPASFSYHTARAQFSAWDWSFHAVRDVAENSYLKNISKGGFSVTGSGGLNVVTAPLYAAGKRYKLSVSGTVPETLRAGSDRRLRFNLDLGPSHEVQQYDFGADATADWTHLVVRIT
jgi:S-formylglutathione hydrolase FrmB